MNATATGGLVFALTMAGIFIGFWLRSRLPARQLDNDTQSSVKDVNGLIGTMTALILGLVTASAQESFSTIGRAVEHTAADVLALDRLLARYGPEAVGIRRELYGAVEMRMNQIWPATAGSSTPENGATQVQGMEQIGSLVQGLDAQTPNEQWLKSRALELTESLLAARWGIVAGQASPIPTAFFVIIVFWLAATFAGYALFAPRNGTITAILVISAFSVACVIFLILELGNPFDGLIVVSGDPLRFALGQLGK